jgi:hypothetical protein
MDRELAAAAAAELMSQGVVGRAITRLLLDFSVTLQAYVLGLPTVEIKLETPFEVLGAADEPVSIHPENLGDRAIEVAALFGAVIREVSVEATGILTVSFDDGQTIKAPPDASYESWSYVSDNGGRVICTPGGELAIWDTVT